MKKSILTVVTFALLTGALLTGCNNPSEKVANAEDKLIEANKDLDKANAEYLAEMETYRKEAAAKIAANNESIAAFNARIETEKMEARADYQKKITALEQKNTDMKRRMDGYKAEGKDNWEKFKTEFNRDLEELGKAFKDLTVKNVK